MDRPKPPQNEGFQSFVPATGLVEWAKETFVLPASPLENQDHAHLIDARIGALWAFVPNSRHMISVVGQAELPTFQGNKWSRARQDQQILDWFGDELDFLLTFDAGFAQVCDDASFCALVEHELYHCGQALNEFGEPRFKRTGEPVYAIRGHDVEEFVGVVRRYGYGHGAGKTMELVEAAKQRPTVAAARIAGACGTCKAQV